LKHDQEKAVKYMLIERGGLAFHSLIALNNRISKLSFSSISRNSKVKNF